MRKMKKVICFVLALVMMLTVAGCGSGTEPEAAEMGAEVTPEAPEAEVTEIETADLDEAADAEATEEPEETEEEVEEPEEILTYVEENGLEYTTEWGFETTGYALNAMDHADHVDVPVWFELSNISVEDAEEEGFKTVTVKQAITGYRWFDGREKKTDVLFPSVAVADSYTGQIIPSNMTHYDEVLEGDGDIEWKDNTWHISYTEESKWDFENEWKPLSDGNFAGWCTFHDTLTITIPEDYDGLVLLLPPVSLLTESIEAGEHILDYWGEDGKDSYIFNALEMAKEGDEDAETETPATTDAKADKAETAKPDSTATTTAPKQEETKTQEQKTASKPAHTHSYTSSVTANPTCTNNGTKTFTCSCGDSYTESIPATGHQWETRTETIHHDSLGHMESTPGEERNSFQCNYCHSTFGSTDELMSHMISNSDTCNNSGWTIITESSGATNTWVVDQEAWDETVTYNVCSVCGTTQ